MKQLALFLAVLAWLAIRTRILIMYWRAYPGELAGLALMVAMLWWSSTAEDVGLYIKAVQAAAIAFLIARLVRRQYGRARQHLLAKSLSSEVPR